MTAHPRCPRSVQEAHLAVVRLPHQNFEAIVRDMEAAPRVVHRIVEVVLLCVSQSVRKRPPKKKRRNRQRVARPAHQEAVLQVELLVDRHGDLLRARHGPRQVVERSVLVCGGRTAEARREDPASSRTLAPRGRKRGRASSVQYAGPLSSPQRPGQRQAGARAAGRGVWRTSDDFVLQVKEPPLVERRGLVRFLRAGRRSLLAGRPSGAARASEKPVGQRRSQLRTNQKRT